VIEEGEEKDVASFNNLLQEELEIDNEKKELIRNFLYAY
jgi:hypothetical protein